ncbi:hypothetical protein [Micromonospora marina]|uniref:hypothetical protein n=1 Tax=Micromonospora marina TaxID=307120 RepID=UPI003453C345
MLDPRVPETAPGGMLRALLGVLAYAIAGLVGVVLSIPAAPALPRPRRRVDRGADTERGAP